MNFIRDGTLVLSFSVKGHVWIDMKYFAGILREDGSIQNDASIKRLAEISVNYAKAGKLLFRIIDMSLSADS